VTAVTSSFLDPVFGEADDVDVRLLSDDVLARLRRHERQRAG
jgi:hypothetical protein